jgi:drug/metabolite transporter (DMT)-like permease
MESSTIASSPWKRLGFLQRRPVLTAAAGAGCIASSGVLVRLSGASPETVAVFRCLYAIPLLGAFALWERRALGPLPVRARYLAWIAGVFFAIDLVAWHHTIEAVGAGLATVLGNLQVVLVGFVAWAVLSEKPHRGLMTAVPIVLFGVVLISGVLGGEAYGESPVAGVFFGGLTSVAYAGYILTLREGSRDLRRIAGPLFNATVVAAVAAAIFAVVTGTFAAPEGLDSHGWLAALALTSQVVGWLLISLSLPRLPAAITSIVLLLQPVGAMVLARVVLEETPSVAQISGAILILVGVIVATRGRTEQDPESPPPDPVVERVIAR